MKRIYKYTLVTILSMSLVMSCDNGFDEMNTNPVRDAAIEEINGQYWMSSYLSSHEVWANFRRSDYPTVAPNPYPGGDLTTEDFIRRLTYPDSEQSVNNENLSAAVSRMGPDILDTRVWWDVK